MLEFGWLLYDPDGDFLRGVPFHAAWRSSDLRRWSCFRALVHKGLHAAFDRIGFVRRRASLVDSVRLLACLLAFRSARDLLIRWRGRTIWYVRILHSSSPLHFYSKIVIFLNIAIVCEVIYSW